MLGIAWKTRRNLNFVLAWPAKIAGAAKKQGFLATLSRLESRNFIEAAWFRSKVLGN